MVYKMGDYSYVVSGALLECEYGSDPNYLNLHESYGVYVKGKAICTVKDRLVPRNIKTFGECEKEGVCEPEILMDWVNGKEDVFIDGIEALIDLATVTCKHGGKISVIDDGQE